MLKKGVSLEVRNVKKGVYCMELGSDGYHNGVTKLRDLISEPTASGRLEFHHHAEVLTLEIHPSPRIPFMFIVWGLAIVRAEILTFENHPSPHSFLWLSSGDWLLCAGEVWAC